MIPGAGLYLPETLYRKVSSESTDPEVTRLKMFSKHVSRPRQESRDSDSSAPTVESPSQEEGVDIYASIATAYDYADDDAATNGTEPSALISLIHNARDGLTEASRLYLSPAVDYFLEAWPEERYRTENVVHDVRAALNDIGAYFESVQAPTGKYGGWHRKVERALTNPKKLAAKQEVLATNYQSLTNAITMMKTVEQCNVTSGIAQDPIFEAPTQPVKRINSRPIRGPYSRREYRQSQKNLALSSGSLEHYKIGDGGSDSTLAELPGSTPDDLMNTRNMDFFHLTRGFDSVRRPSMRRRSYGSTSSWHSSTASVRSSRRGYSPLQRHSVLAISSDVNIASPSVPNMAVSMETSSKDPKEITSQERSPPPSSPVNKMSTAPSAPLSTLEETSLERNESTSSNNTSTTIPKYVRRQHPRSRHRHRSLPNLLPAIPGQPSLSEQLANWFPLGSQSSDCSTTEWDASSTISSPQNSIASCSVITEEFEEYNPVIETASVATQHSPEPDRKTVHIRSGSASSPRRSDELFFGMGDRRPRSESTKDNSRASTPNSSKMTIHEEHQGNRRFSGSVVRKPLPPSSMFTLNVIPPTPVSAFGRPALHLFKSSNSDMPKIDAISEDDTTPPAIATPDPIRSVPHVATSKQVHPVERTAVCSPPSIPDKLPILPPKELVTAAEPVPPPNSVLAETTVPPTDTTPQPSPAPSKPMTAQAKRRAAHQRRMELAFGSK